MISRKTIMMAGIFTAWFFVSLIPVFAQNEIQSGLDEAGQEVYLTDDSSNKLATDPSSITGQVVGILLRFVGVLFFVLATYGGIIWLLARGNEERVNEAKLYITSAVIGLIIVLASFVITNEIFQQAPKILAQ